MIKQIKDLENYYISDRGEVINIKTGNSIKIHTNKGEQNFVVLYATNYKVPYLVADAFIENPNNYKYVRHINEDYNDNSVENLEWCRFKESKRNRKVNQYTLKGELVAEYNSLLEAAFSSGAEVTDECIRKCCIGKILTAGGYTWRFK